MARQQLLLSQRASETSVVIAFEAVELERLMMQVGLHALVTPRTTLRIRILVDLAHALAARTALHVLDVEALDVLVAGSGSASSLALQLGHLVLERFEAVVRVKVLHRHGHAALVACLLEPRALQEIVVLLIALHDATTTAIGANDEAFVAVLQVMHGLIVITDEVASLIAALELDRLHLVQDETVDRLEGHIVAAVALLWAEALSLEPRLNAVVAVDAVARGALLRVKGYHGANRAHEVFSFLLHGFIASDVFQAQVTARVVMAGVERRQLILEALRILLAQSLLNGLHGVVG